MKRTARKQGRGCSTTRSKSAGGLGRGGSSSKMSQEPSPQKTAGTLQRWLESCLGQDLLHLKVAGKIPVALLDLTDSSSGQYWMRAGSASRNVGGERISCLTDILETDPVDDRFYLTAKCCLGILNRASKKGKKLPENLERALKINPQNEMARKLLKNLREVS